MTPHVLETALLIESIKIYFHGASTCIKNLCLSNRSSSALCLISDRLNTMDIYEYSPLTFRKHCISWPRTDFYE